MPRPWLVVLAVLVLVLITAGFFWRIPGVAVQAAQGTGRVSGRVVDVSSGLGVAGALVGVMDERGSPTGLTVTADDSGRFLLADLAPGTYLFTAEKAGYIGLPTFRARARARVRVAAHQQHEVSIELTRAAVLEGRILDPAGLPMAYARAQVLRAGRADDGFFYVDANRAGEFRLAGVRAGRYVLRGIPMNEDLAGLTRLMPTYHPSADDVADATVIEVEPGETRTGLDVTLHAVKTALITGQVLDAFGRPYDLHGRVEPMARYGRSLRPVPLLAGTDSGDVGPDGRFRLRLPVGPHRLTATPSSIGSVSVGGPADVSSVMEALAGLQREILERGEQGSADVDLGEAGLSDLSLRLERSRIATGRVVFEGTHPPPPQEYFTLDVLSVGPDPSDRVGVVGPMPDWRVELHLHEGSWMAQAFAAPPWTLKSVLYDGIDMTQHPVVLGGAEPPKDLLVVMTDRPTSLAFRVSDDRGTATRDYVAVVFKTDGRVRGHGDVGRVRWHVPAGTMTEGDTIDLPCGEYYVIAVDDLEFDAVHDPDVLEALSQHATMVTLEAGAQRTVALQRVPMLDALTPGAARGR